MTSHAGEGGLGTLSNYNKFCHNDLANIKYLPRVNIARKDTLCRVTSFTDWRKCVLLINNYQKRSKNWYFMQLFAEDTLKHIC